jgi:hypothetical protein
LRAACDESLEGVRDHALLCFGFASGGHRRSEIAAADMRHLRRIGPHGFIYRLEHSKTQQAGVHGDLDPRQAGARRLAGRGGYYRGSNFPTVMETPYRARALPAAVGEIVQRRATWQACRETLAGIVCARVSSPKAAGKAWPCPR